MTAMSGGEALVQSIVREGVEVIFGIPGIQMSGIITALRDEPRIRMITTRHEQAAAHMADGYARVSGKPGVILVVPGAGGYNAASGLATAYARSAPVLAIAGQIPRDHIGRGFGTYHEVLDQSSIVQPVTKWRQQALTPREIPAAVSEAFRQMRTGRPRPTLIEIPPEAGVERDASSAISMSSLAAPTRPTCSTRTSSSSPSPSAPSACGPTTPLNSTRCCPALLSCRRQSSSTCPSATCRFPAPDSLPPCRRPPGPDPKQA